MKPVPGGGGSGGSRAAKKRARKRQMRPTAAAEGGGEPRKSAKLSATAISAVASGVRSSMTALEQKATAKAAAKALFDRGPLPQPKVAGDPSPTLQEAQEVVEAVDSNTNGQPELLPAALDGLTIQDSTEIGGRVLEWLLHPLPLADFHQRCWERRCLVVQRQLVGKQAAAGGAPSYYRDLYSSVDLRAMLSDCRLEYNVDVDLSRYTATQGRTALQREGTADAKTLWAAVEENEYTIRYNRPHVHSKRLWQLMGWLEEYWGSGVAANLYVTPPGSSGFAPHFCNVEVFALQLEGHQHWKVWAPANESGLLPTAGSGDLSEAQVWLSCHRLCQFACEHGVVNCGRSWGSHCSRRLWDRAIYFTFLVDLLSSRYCTRYAVAFKSKAAATQTEKSLELRLSTGQAASFVNLLQAALPQALALAAEEDIRLRRLLPRDALHYMGVTHSDPDEALDPLGMPPALVDRAAAEPLEAKRAARTAFLAHAQKLATAVLQVLPSDAAVDQLAKNQLIEYRLPPPFAAGQLRGSIEGKGVKEKVTIHEDTQIRLAAKGAARLCVEGDMATVYHCIDNAAPETVQFRGRTAQSIVFSIDFAPAIDQIIRAYPAYTCVSELAELDDIEEAVELAGTLFELGLVHVDRKTCEKRE